MSPAVHRVAYPRQCSTWPPGADRCKAIGTRYLLHPDGTPSGFACEHHATALVTEYREKLGWEWTALEVVVEDDHRPGPPITEVARYRAYAALHGLAPETMLERDRLRMPWSPTGGYSSTPWRPVTLVLPGAKPEQCTLPLEATP